MQVRLMRIVTYMQEHDSPDAGRRVGRTIYERAERLQTLPNRGRPGRVDGTRELVLAPLPIILVFGS